MVSVASAAPATVIWTANSTPTGTTRASQRFGPFRRAVGSLPIMPSGRPKPPVGAHRVASRRARAGGGTGGRHMYWRTTCAVITGPMLAGGGVFGLLSSPASASPVGAETDPTAATTDTTAAATPVVAETGKTTLPLFGVQLTVDVSTTPGGALAMVDVNPADKLTATKVH